MYPMIHKTLKDYYNVKDTQGNTHTGFLQAMDFTGMSFPVLNEITVSILDAYIFNRLSKCVALNQWGEYLHYDANIKELRIDAAFYTDFVNALFVELMQADKFNTSILKADFTALSAKDLKKITYGTRTTNRNYDNVVLEIKRGNDTEGTTARTDTHTAESATDTHTTQQATDMHTTQQATDTHTTQQATDTHTAQTYTDTHSADAVQDTHGTTARTDTETPGTKTTTSRLYPLGASAYVDDTQSTEAQTQSTRETGAQTQTDNLGVRRTSDVMGARSESDVIGARSESDVIGARSESDVIGARSESDVIGARSSSDITGAQTKTKTYGDVTNETKEREDVETIQTHIDTEEHTKHVIISPEKYFEIERELANINAFTLVADAVKKTFAASFWQ